MFGNTSNVTNQEEKKSLLLNIESHNNKPLEKLRNCIALIQKVENKKYICPAFGILFLVGLTAAASKLITLALEVNLHKNVQKYLSYKRLVPLEEQFNTALFLNIFGKEKVCNYRPQSLDSFGTDCRYAPLYGRHGIPEYEGEKLCTAVVKAICDEQKTIQGIIDRDNGYLALYISVITFAVFLALVIGAGSRYSVYKRKNKGIGQLLSATDFNQVEALCNHHKIPMDETTKAHDLIKNLREKEKTVSAVVTFLLCTKKEGTHLNRFFSANGVNKDVKSEILKHLGISI